jgi:hypothetical protein
MAIGKYVAPNFPARSTRVSPPIVKSEDISPRSSSASRAWRIVNGENAKKTTPAAAPAAKHRESHPPNVKPRLRAARAATTRNAIGRYLSAAAAPMAAPAHANDRTVPASAARATASPATTIASVKSESTVPKCASRIGRNENVKRNDAIKPARGEAIRAPRAYTAGIVKTDAIHESHRCVKRGHTGSAANSAKPIPAGSLPIAVNTACAIHSAPRTA